jgi:hypothetical protein
MEGFRDYISCPKGQVTDGPLSDILQLSEHLEALESPD